MFDFRTRKTRMVIVGAILWLVIALSIAFGNAEKCNPRANKCFFSLSTFGASFLAMGVAPTVLVVGALWVIGSPKNSKVGEKPIADDNSKKKGSS